MTPHPRWWLLAAAVFGGCPPVTPPETDTDIIELIGPEITHEPLVGPVDEGTALTVSATAVDAIDGVSRMTLFYRTFGEAAYETLFLTLGDDQAWTGVIPSDQVEAPGLEYYLTAEDGSDFRVTTWLPEAGEDAPIPVEVDVLGTDVPWSEDVEGAETALTLFDLGWQTYSAGFPGAEWGLTRARAHAGTWGFLHAPSAEGVGTIDDWLVSPALRVEGTDPFQVSWFESALDAERADHELWISVGSPDPDDGDYTLVAELVAAPEGAWRRSPVIPIPENSRGKAVYLAWRYQGVAADAWYLDDVSVDGLGPDVQLDDVVWTRVDPGGTSTISLSLRNGTDVDALDLVVSGTSPGGTFDALAPLDLVGAAELVVDLELDVDASWPDNARLPISLSATDGIRTWTWERSVVVGDAPRGRVTIRTAGDGLLQVAVGSGDPDAPTARIPVVSELFDAGEHLLSFDLLDASSTLPPGPGDNRWWVEVLSGTNAEVLGFEIDFDGEVHRAVGLSTVPRDVVTRFFLPRPPEPIVSGTSTVPARVSPGATAVWSVSLRNTGTDTTGDTWATFSSLDPNVILLDVDPILIAADQWSSFQTVTVELDVDVLDTKTDARPAVFDVLIEDNHEEWSLRASLDVPWAVLQVFGVVIDDFSDGDDDGLLEDGEQVNLDVSLANIGTLGTVGSVSCTLSQLGGDVTATLVDATGSFSQLDPREVDAEDDFEIRVGTAELADTLSFQLRCLDSSSEFIVPFELVIGEKPWIGMSVARDPIGDNVNAYEFDLVSGQYRAQRGYLQLRLVSATPYDPTSVFIESWFSSPGAGYQFYQVVAQSGAGSTRGYRFGFTRLNPDPTVIVVDEYTLQIDVPVASLGLAANQVSAGFASGFCGDPTYFCDHYPDGWGDPQSAFATALWLPLTW